MLSAVVTFIKSAVPWASKVLLLLAARATAVSVYTTTQEADYPTYLASENTASILSRKMVSASFAGFALALMRLGAVLPFLDSQVLNFYTDEIWRLSNHAYRTPYGVHLAEES
jgi:hypothetical protein